MKSLARSEQAAETGQAAFLREEILNLSRVRRHASPGELKQELAITISCLQRSLAELENDR